ncbi:Disease resistance protein RPM1 [Glycine soja]
MPKLQEIAVSLAVDYLLPPIKKAVNSVMEVPKDAADMNDKLDGIQAMIHDADKMAAAEEGNSRDGLKAKVKQLVETSFCMEDIVDEYIIHEERQLADDPGCASLPCKAVDFVKTTASRLQFAYMNQDVKSEFHGIKEGNKSEDCSQIQSSGGNQNITFDNLRMAPLFLKEAEVVGFDSPRDTLERWLKEGREKLTVVSVVGMGGSGKTTLAKKVFDKVQTHFTRHVWITVSQSYTIEGLLLKFLEAEKGKDSSQSVYSTMDKASLIHEVRNHLSCNRYVVVFDDVWNENFWEEMKFALVDVENGSRIIITTRHREVAESCRTSSLVQVHELQPLTDDKSFELFCKTAFRSELDGHCPHNLKGISTEIVKKCEGLPLAIVATGGLLSRKSRDAREWQRFSENLSSELGKHPKLTPVTKILGLSYYDLPYHLKPCFLYFGIYPEDYEVECGRLILQWVAEGFVKSDEAAQTLEEVAEKYLNELIQRSLVQVSSFTWSGKIKRCRVHDVVREMIREKNQDLSFCHSASERGNLSRSGMIRRLTIASGSNNLTGSVESSNIRSLHVFSDEELSESLVKSMPTKYRLLRVLQFAGAPMDDFPRIESLGDLSFLRYLSFRRSSIVHLPKLIGELHNLETLDLRETYVRVMPREIYKLKKLRHLLRDFEGFEMDGGIGDLTSLQTLRRVNISHNTEEVVKGLEKLTQLRVLGLTQVEPRFKSFLCSLINKMQHLEKLYITARDGSTYGMMDLHFDVFAPVLQKVRLMGRLKKFPNWVAKLQNLVTLSLSFTELTHDPLPLLKDLPNLTHLSILLHAYISEVLQFPNRGFPNLKQILLADLFPLKSIVIEDGALPSLEKLKLFRIRELTEVPRGIDKLPKLKMNLKKTLISTEDNVLGLRRNHWLLELFGTANLATTPPLFAAVVRSPPVAATTTTVINYFLVTTRSGLMGDLLFEAQAMASGKNSKKRGYLSLNEGNNTLHRRDEEEEASLIHEVRNHLSHNRYVVVFDDVWNENFWEEMKFALVDVENGSRIIITTRHREVAESCRTSSLVQVHELLPLTDDKSFELFCKTAFGSELDGHCPNNLKGISTEIVKKCEGLPLAIVATGGLLSRKSRDAREWLRFRENLSSELGKHPKLTPVKKILGLSYYDLPYHLKPCFLYFGIYPEDYEVECEGLILQWVAQGFVKSDEAAQTLEEVAEKYLNELIQRSLVQVSSVKWSDKINSCRVHDVVREMIREKNQDLSFCHSASERGNLSKSGMIRHLTIASDSNNLMGSVESSNIRSLHVFSDEELSESLVKSVPTKYRLLRVLQFEGASMYHYDPMFDSVAPIESLGDLSFLRYLSFRSYKINYLPKLIGELHNLETLDLRYTRVRKMRREIYKLKKCLVVLTSYQSLRFSIVLICQMNLKKALISTEDNVESEEMVGWGGIKSLRRSGRGRFWRKERLERKLGLRRNHWLLELFGTANLATTPPLFAAVVRSPPVAATTTTVINYFLESWSLMEGMANISDDASNGENGFLAMFGGDESGGGGSGGVGSSGDQGGGNVEDVALKKGPWTTAEDVILMDYVTKNGEGNWNAVQRNTGLNRCGKSCRHRWANHLRPNLKKGAFSPEEEKLIVDLHAQFGNKWARMAALDQTPPKAGSPFNTIVPQHQPPPTTPFPCLTPTGSNPNIATSFELFNQNQQHHQQQQYQYQQQQYQQHPLSPTASHHSLLSSPLQHRQPFTSSSPHNFLDHSPLPLSSSSSPSPLSFTFQRPAPMLSTPLRFKRYCASPSYNNNLSDPPLTTQFPHLDGLRFPVSSGFSQFFQPSLLDSDRGVSSSSSSLAFQPKLELPLSQYYKPPEEQDIKLDIEFNDPSFQSSSSGLMGDLLFEAQAMASGKNSKKRGYLSLNEGNNVFEDFPSSSLYGPSSTSEPKPKEEAPDFSKFMNGDLSSLLTVIPSSNMQGHEWHNNSAREMSNVQSSVSGMTDDNFGLDIKPIASLFPLSNTTNHDENQGCYSWDNLPGLC